MHRLNGKVALVSGAARGIGAAIARAFAAQGAFVLVTDIDEVGAAAQAEQLGACAAHTRLDVREEADWIAAVDGLLAARGKIDVVVNNAGVTGFEDGMVPHDPEHASLADWRAVHAVNLDGVFLGCKHAIRAMRPARLNSGRPTRSSRRFICIETALWVLWTRSPARVNEPASAMATKVFS